MPTLPKWSKNGLYLPEEISSLEILQKLNKKVMKNSIREMLIFAVFVDF